MRHCASARFYTHYTAQDPSTQPSGRAGPSDNGTFVRGRQISNRSGMVRFQPTCPGSYTPRG